MEFRVSPAGDRQITKDLFKRFLRTAGALNNEIQLVRIYANGTGFTGAKLEIPEDCRTRQIHWLAGVDGLKLTPVPEDQNT